LGAIFLELRQQADMVLPTICIGISGEDDF